MSILNVVPRVLRHATTVFVDLSRYRGGACGHGSGSTNAVASDQNSRRLSQCGRAMGSECVALPRKRER